jgi:hypothetical protein
MDNVHIEALDVWSVIARYADWPALINLNRTCRALYMIVYPVIQKLVRYRLYTFVAYTEALDRVDLYCYYIKARCFVRINAVPIGSRACLKYKGQYKNELVVVANTRVHYGWNNSGQYTYLLRYNIVTGVWSSTLDLNISEVRSVNLHDDLLLLNVYHDEKLRTFDLRTNEWAGYSDIPSYPQIGNFAGTLKSVKGNLYYYVTKTASCFKYDPDRAIWSEIILPGKNAWLDGSCTDLSNLQIHVVDDRAVLITSFINNATTGIVHLDVETLSMARYPIKDHAKDINCIRPIHYIHGSYCYTNEQYEIRELYIQADTLVYSSMQQSCHPHDYTDIPVDASTLEDSKSP